MLTTCLLLLRVELLQFVHGHDKSHSPAGCHATRIFQHPGFSFPCVQLYGLCIQPLMGMALLALPVAILGAGFSSALGFIPTYLAYAANGGSYVGASAAKGAVALACAAAYGICGIVLGQAAPSQLLLRFSCAPQRTMFPSQGARCWPALPLSRPAGATLVAAGSVIAALLAVPRMRFGQAALLFYIATFLLSVRLFSTYWVSGPQGGRAACRSGAGCSWALRSWQPRQLERGRCMGLLCLWEWLAGCMVVPPLQRARRTLQTQPPGVGPTRPPSTTHPTTHPTPPHAHIRD